MSYSGNKSTLDVQDAKTFNKKARKKKKRPFSHIQNSDIYPQHETRVRNLRSGKVSFILKMFVYSVKVFLFVSTFCDAVHGDTKGEVMIP